MYRTPLTRLAAAALTVVLGVGLAGCADEEPAPKANDRTAGLATAEAGDLTLKGGFAYATTPMGDMESSDAGMDMDHSDDAAGMESSDAGMDMSEMGMMTAAFATISNAGDAEDALVGVKTDITDVAQVHETVTNEDGTGATMREVEEIVVPAGGSVKLEPGGSHIMLMNLKTDLAAGTTVTLTLTFRSGTTMTVDFPVIDREDRPQP